METFIAKTGLRFRELGNTGASARRKNENARDTRTLANSPLGFSTSGQWRLLMTLPDAGAFSLPNRSAVFERGRWPIPTAAQFIAYRRL